MVVARLVAAILVRIAAMAVAVVAVVAVGARARGSPVATGRVQPVSRPVAVAGMLRPERVVDR